jgi:hypothetical protein
MIRFIYFLLFAVATGFVSQRSLRRNSFNACSLRMSDTSSIVVISPPGGVGEVAAVKAACSGSSVRWFVISDASSSSVSLSPQALEEIEAASGKLELAGSNVEDLKNGGDALSAVSKWCGTANGLICTYDGSNEDGEFKAAIRLAVQEASPGVSGPQLAILAAEDDLDDDEGSEQDGRITDFISSLFRDSPKIPSSLVRALTKNACKVRHGQLFGKPESSPEFSPLVGGPRRDPDITEEYTMRDIRVDPFVLSGNTMASNSFKACRHAVGEAAALIVTGAIPVPPDTVSISSQTGTEKVTIEKWQQEFERVKEVITSGKASDLFSQEIIVDDTERLADWLATKWAPAILRTYDIAAIRIGARPVYATRSNSGTVEIVWQELVDYQSLVVGRMILQVNEDGITATRGAGDAKAGFGGISKKPLPGEAVLVSRLAEATSQAIEKGLAKKVRFYCCSDTNTFNVLVSNIFLLRFFPRNPANQSKLCLHL